MSSLKKINKSVPFFVTQAIVWGNLFFRRPSVFDIGQSSLWAPPGLHQGALCSGVSPQFVRSPMQQDVIAGSQCGRNSLPAILACRRGLDATAGGRSRQQKDLTQLHSTAYLSRCVHACVCVYMYSSLL